MGVLFYFKKSCFFRINYVFLCFPKKNNYFFVLTVSFFFLGRPSFIILFWNTSFVKLSFPKSNTTMGDSVPTLGMRLDDMISEIDRLPSSQLYGIIVAVTVGLCVVLLGTGNSTNFERQQEQQHQRQQQMINDNNDLAKPQKSTTPASDGVNQPKWHIFKWINCLAVVAFLWSVYTFCSNASQYLHHESQGVLVQFLVGWSIFLLYFFGFFGVSLIHDDIPKEHDETTNVINSNIPRYVFVIAYYNDFVPINSIGICNR